MTPENVAEVHGTRDARDSEFHILESLQRFVPVGEQCLPLGESNTALILPWPFVHCITRSKWGWIAMQASARWPKVCCAIPIVSRWRRFELANNEPDAGVGEVDLQDESRLFVPRMYQDLADYLRDRVGILQAGATDPEAERAQAENFVMWLERCVKASSVEAVEDDMVGSSGTRGGHFF